MFDIRESLPLLLKLFISSYFRWKELLCDTVKANKETYDWGLFRNTKWNSCVGHTYN